MPVQRPHVPAGTFDPEAGIVGAGAVFHVGDPVWVHAMGSWYQGTVTKIGRTNATVTYTSGAGNTRTKSVNPNVPEAANLRPGASRGSGETITSPLILHPAAYRALAKRRLLRDSETWPTCECGASRDPWTGVLKCAR